MKKLLLLAGFLGIASFINAQTNINIQIISPGGDTTICAGDTVILQSTSAFLANDFNNGQIGVGWQSTQANPVFNNPCGPGPVAAHLWVGTTPSNNRTIETISYDLTNGSACYVEFWMRYGLVPGSGNCEDPDAATEGVHLQYSINNGAWVDFPGPNVSPVGTFTTVPAGGNTIPPFITTTPGTGGYWAPTFGSQATNHLYHWNLYQCPIPAAAISSNTRFRWAQLVTSSTGFDAWGIDEVIIGCAPPSLIWSPTGTTTTADTVAPLDTTTYIVTAYDTAGNSASDTITLNVIPPPRLENDLTASCGDTTFIINVDAPVLCNSVSADGSDFRLKRPNNNGPEIPVIGATPINCQNGFTTQIEIQALFPLSSNGDYVVYIKEGFDFNTLVSECGDVPEFDSLVITVSDCYNIYMDLLNVTVINDQHTEVEWAISADTAMSFVNSIFEEYRILRSQSPTGPYTQVGTVNDINITTWEDNAPGGSSSPLTNTDVNTNNYNYIVQAVYDGGQITESDSIQTILLDCVDNTDTLLFDLTWSEYWGWSPAEYFIMQRGLGQTNWTQVGQTSNTNFTYTKPLDANEYTLKIETREPTTGALISESNYCRFDVPVRDPKVKMPNVFSPDGDGINDFFNTITANDSTVNIEQFEGIVYNRWGQKIFEWTDWEIMENGWDGGNSPEGTYFYVVRAFGREGQIVEESGHFMLLRE
jgi:gliding motility-associated-like protein